MCVCTHIGDEDGFLELDVCERKAVFARARAVWFASKFVFLLLRVFKMRGDVSLPVS